jgi:hypothetical protein
MRLCVKVEGDRSIWGKGASLQLMTKMLEDGAALGGQYAIFHAWPVSCMSATVFADLVAPLRWSMWEHKSARSIYLATPIILLELSRGVPISSSAFVCRKTNGTHCRGRSH